MLRSFVREHVFLMAIAAIAVALWLAGDPAREYLALDFQAVDQGQLWRLISGHFVHLGGYHTLLNLIGLAVYVALCPAALCWQEWARRWLFLCLATGLALWLWADEIGRYSGLSGVIHGLFLLGLWPQARRGDWVAIAALTYLVGKLAWEQWAGAPVSDAEAIGGPVVTESHLFGTLSALLYAILFRKFRTGERHT